MLNRIEIMGNLVDDPELRITGSGIKVCNFRIACERDYASSDRHKEVDFVDCVAWREKAESVGIHFSKGMPILVSGRLQMRKWEDHIGTKRTTAEIQADDLYFAGGEKRKSQRDEGFLEKAAVNDEYEKFGWAHDDEGELPF